MTEKTIQPHRLVIRPDLLKYIRVYEPYPDFSGRRMQFVIGMDASNPANVPHELVRFIRKDALTLRTYIRPPVETDKPHLLDYALRMARVTNRPQDSVFKWAQLVSCAYEVWRAPRRYTIPGDESSEYVEGLGLLSVRVTISREKMAADVAEPGRGEERIEWPNSP